MKTKNKVLSPIFIIGSPRSGTTLLQFILSSHPNIYIPDETGFIPFLLDQESVTKPLSLSEVEALLQRIGRLNYLWRDLVTDIPVFYQNLNKPTLAYILDALFGQIIAKQNATRWGDKTPLYVRHIPYLAKIFPCAQFIHIIRDGRDATLSAQQKWGLSRFWYMDNYYLLQNWVTNVSLGCKEGAQLQKSNYLEVRYEQLVQEPESMTRSICSFLNETYNPAMLAHNQLARQVGPGPDDHTEVMKPITAESIGRWRTQMSVFDQKMAGQIAGALLGELGYDQSNPGEYTAFEKLRLAFLTAKYRFSESFRHLLYATGILTLNRNMRSPYQKE